MWSRILSWHENADSAALHSAAKSDGPVPVKAMLPTMTVDWNTPKSSLVASRYAASGSGVRLTPCTQSMSRRLLLTSRRGGDDDPTRGVDEGGGVSDVARPVGEPMMLPSCDCPVAATLSARDAMAAQAPCSAGSVLVLPLIGAVVDDF